MFVIFVGFMYNIPLTDDLYSTQLSLERTLSQPPFGVTLVMFLMSRLSRFLSTTALSSALEETIRMVSDVLI